MRKWKGGREMDARNTSPPLKPPHSLIIIETAEQVPHVKFVPLKSDQMKVIKCQSPIFNPKLSIRTMNGGPHKLKIAIPAGKMETENTSNMTKNLYEFQVKRLGKLKHRKVVRGYSTKIDHFRFFFKFLNLNLK